MSTIPNLAAAPVDAPHARRWRLSKSELLLFVAPLFVVLFAFAWMARGKHAGRIVSAPNEATLALAYMPDGTLVYGGGGGYEHRTAPANIKFWDMSEGTPARTLTDSGVQISARAISPDGKLLAGGGIGTLSLWGLPDYGLRWTIRAHLDAVSSVTFSPDATLLASTSGDGMVKMWQANHGTLLWARGPLRRGRGPDQVVCAAFAPDGKTLASVGNDNKLKLWNPRTGALFRSLAVTGKKPWVVAVAYSPDGKLLATGNTGALTLWNARTWRVLLCRPGEHVALAFSPDSKLLAALDTKHTLQLLRMPSGKLVRAFPPTQPRPQGSFWAPKPTGYYVACASGVAFAPDGKTVAHTDGDGVAWEKVTN